MVLHDDRCLRQLFIPCQVTEEIADNLPQEAADNAHCVAPSDINTWNLNGGKGDFNHLSGNDHPGRNG